MTNLPSKELLSAVLGCEVFDKVFYASNDIRKMYLNGNELAYSTKSYKFTYTIINIHELVHMIKEWAWKTYGYQIVEQVDSVYVYWFSEKEEKPKQTLINNIEELNDFDITRVVEAGEWILEQTKQVKNKD